MSELSGFALAGFEAFKGNVGKLSSVVLQEYAHAFDQMGTAVIDELARRVVEGEPKSDDPASPTFVAGQNAADAAQVSTVAAGAPVPPIPSQPGMAGHVPGAVEDNSILTAASSPFDTHGDLVRDIDRPAPVITAGTGKVPDQDTDKREPPPAIGPDNTVIPGDRPLALQEQEKGLAPAPEPGPVTGAPSIGGSLAPGGAGSLGHGFAADGDADHAPVSDQQQADVGAEPATNDAASEVAAVSNTEGSGEGAGDGGDVAAGAGGEPAGGSGAPASDGMPGTADQPVGEDGGTSGSTAADPIGDAPAGEPAAATADGAQDGGTTAAAEPAAEGGEPATKEAAIGELEDADLMSAIETAGADGTAPVGAFEATKAELEVEAFERGLIDPKPRRGKRKS